MKKSIVALAVAAAAFSGVASAKVELYSGNDVTVQVSGEVDAVMKTDQWTPKSSAEEKVKRDPKVSTWGNVQFDMDYRISSSTTAFASFEMEADNSAGVKVDDAKAGFVNASAGTFTFGETGDALDAVEKTDITNEGSYLATMSHPTESAGNGVRWQKDVAGVAFSVDAQTGVNSEDDNAYGLSADWAVNDMFTVGAAYVDQGKVDGESKNVVALSASAEFNNFYVAATVSQYNNFGGVEHGSQKESYELIATDGMSYGLAAAYQMEATRFYATYETIQADNLPGSKADLDADLSAYTVGVDHQIAKNVLVFVEYNGITSDNTKNKITAEKPVSVDTSGRGDQVVVGAYLTF